MNALTDRQAWLFSIKTYLAAVAALYIAMAGNLSRPYWAMGTVYIVSQPLRARLRQGGRVPHRRHPGGRPGHPAGAALQETPRWC
jgi:uncharacterized membrane protein YccC